MFTTIPSSTVIGVDGHSVAVEIHLSSGLPGCTIVGLPDTACREARDRVRSAIITTGLTWPSQRMTINLAPSMMRKAGAAFDLAIAVGILVASEQLPPEAIRETGFLGELGLDGVIRPVDGMVPLAAAVDAAHLIVPAACVNHASLVARTSVRGAHSLGQLIELLKGECSSTDWEYPSPISADFNAPVVPDLADVRGQALGRWALEVAAAGGHNVLMLGPPGSGKTMLAARLSGLLPLLDQQTSLETTRIHSAAGLLRRDQALITQPPFRAPHHTSSQASIVGGGSQSVRPGEISLAHGGVLFLDELGEFPRSVLDTLRQPLEEGVLRLGRSIGNIVFPARFQLVGAMNPCPCGEALTPGACRCAPGARARYVARVSGPLLDRFDVRVRVARPMVEQFFSEQSGEGSGVVAGRVIAARDRAAFRGVRMNAQLEGRVLCDVAPLGEKAESLLSDQLRKGLITARGIHRIHRVALTLADLSGDDPPLGLSHVSAALELRADVHTEAVAS